MCVCKRQLPLHHKGHISTRPFGHANDIVESRVDYSYFLDGYTSAFLFCTNLSIFAANPDISHNIPSSVGMIIIYCFCAYIFLSTAFAAESYQRPVTIRVPSLSVIVEGAEGAEEPMSTHTAPRVVSTLVTSDSGARRTTPNTERQSATPLPRVPRPENRHSHEKATVQYVPRQESKTASRRHTVRDVREAAARSSAPSVSINRLKNAELRRQIQDVTIRHKALSKEVLKFDAEYSVMTVSEINQLTCVSHECLSQRDKAKKLVSMLETIDPYDERLICLFRKRCAECIKLATKHIAKLEQTAASYHARLLRFQQAATLGDDVQVYAHRGPPPDNYERLKRHRHSRRDHTDGPVAID